MVLPVAVALGALGGCKLRKTKGSPDASALASTEGGTGRADAGGAGVPVTTAPRTATAPPVPIDPLAPADRAALEQAKVTIAELERLAKKGVLTNPDKPEDGDATTRCAALEASRSQLESIADATAKKSVTDIKRLCSLEVPLLGADNALTQVTMSPSQASRKLMCGFATKDIEKARRASPGDRRLHDLDGRYARACR